MSERNKELERVRRGERGGGGGRSEVNLGVESKCFSWEREIPFLKQRRQVGGAIYTNEQEGKQKG